MSNKPNKTDKARADANAPVDIAPTSAAVDVVPVQAEMDPALRYAKPGLRITREALRGLQAAFEGDALKAAPRRMANALYVAPGAFESGLPQRAQQLVDVARDLCAEAGVPFAVGAAIDPAHMARHMARHALPLGYLKGSYVKAEGSKWHKPSASGKGRFVLTDKP